MWSSLSLSSLLNRPFGTKSMVHSCLTPNTGITSVLSLSPKGLENVRAILSTVHPSVATHASNKAALPSDKSIEIKRFAPGKRVCIFAAQMHLLEPIKVDQHVFRHRPKLLVVVGKLARVRCLYSATVERLPEW